MTPIRDTRLIQFVAVGLAFAVFGAIDLLILFLTPGQERGTALLPPVISGIVVIAILPCLLSLFEQQQARIERQATEIETLHAMDAAIFSEMEIDRLLPVAADKALTPMRARPSAKRTACPTFPARKRKPGSSRWCAAGARTAMMTGKHWSSRSCARVPGTLTRRLAICSSRGGVSITARSVVRNADF